MPPAPNPDIAFTMPGVTVEFVGNLHLPSGRLVVADVCREPRHETPLRIQLPPGDHPVDMAVVDTEGDRRVAALRLKLSPEPATAWELGFREGPEPGPFADPFSLARVPVDYAVAGFFDATTRALLGDGDPDTGEGAIPDDVLHAEGTTATCFGLEHHPVRGAAANVVLSSSGWGDDGGYPCFIGRNDGGDPVSVVLDFGVIELGLDALLVLPTAPTPNERIAQHRANGLDGKALLMALRADFPDVPLVELRALLAVQ